MTPLERALWQRVQRRAAGLSPELAAAILVAFAILRDELTDDDLARLVQFGAETRLIETAISEGVRLAAYQPLRQRLRQGIIEGVRYYARDIPLPPSVRTLTIGFDLLNPRVIDAIRQLETRVIITLEETLAATVKAAAERGLVAGVNPRATARELRQVVGLGPTQLQEVENFRDALLGRNGRTVRDYARRNRRYDALAARGTITDAQVERAVEAYRKSRVALNAETTARTAALDAQKLAQRLSWEDAIAKGVIDRDEIERTWVGVMDQRERPAHVAMEGQTVGFDERFSNGQLEPGENEYNCRCIVRYGRRRAG